MLVSQSVDLRLICSDLVAGGGACDIMRGPVEERRLLQQSHTRKLVFHEHWIIQQNASMIL